MIISLKSLKLPIFLNVSEAMSACGNTESDIVPQADHTEYTPFAADLSDTHTETNEEQTKVKVSTYAVNTVKKELFGDNISWRGNGYGVYNAEIGRFNEKLLDAIKNSGVTTLRYPGGIEGDYFIWHETIGEDRKLQIDPFSSQYPIYAPADGGKYYPSFGWEEFMEMCIKLGAEAGGKCRHVVTV